MDSKRVMDILSGRAQSPAAISMRMVLYGLSKPYGAVMRLRRWAYRKGIKKSHQAALPVICVGNITTGGTGKTPMVALVVEILKSAGRTPAILTRGYKSVDNKSDEAQLLEKICCCSVIVNPDRVAGANQAKACGADVVVMDDGFQHLRLERDLDILLIDLTNPFGFGKCLPAGLMREPLSALKAAGIIVLTRSDQVDKQKLDETVGIIRKITGSEIFFASHKPVGWIDGNANELPLDAIDVQSKKLAFCGLGNPEAFFDTLVGLGLKPVKTYSLADHAEYDSQTVNYINRQAEKTEAEFVVTTQKDFTKIDPSIFNRPVWQLVVKMQVDNFEHFKISVVKKSTVSTF